ncbi:MAG TPA: hypothetical protein VEZ71_23665, partial [Archangium sp.]|nr:hypothetical protein [Archangium sp.]
MRRINVAVAVFAAGALGACESSAPQSQEEFQGQLEKPLLNDPVLSDPRVNDPLLLDESLLGTP